MINKRCLACDLFRDDCVGRDLDICGNFTRIDFKRADTKEPGETRQQKFARIGKKRQEQALEAVRKLEHLTSRYRRKRTDVTVYTYEWTSKQALELLAPIEAALVKLHDELLTAPLQREHGLLVETK